jgi:hypothetical protein
MATKEVLQEGTVAKPEAKTNTGLRAFLLGSGSAKKAADAVAPNARKSRLDAAEDEAVNGKKYAKGGMVRRGYGAARGA